MVVLNYTGGEINAKIVYYGPGLSGKTTNLEYIHEKTPVGARGKMVSMKTQTDRTLFFDFLPLELGEIGGYRTRFLLYTVPGQVYYNATRKLVLKGADAVVFVADSSRSKLEENLESLRNLEQNLNEHGMSLDEMPWVIQYNKRDAADALPVPELDARLNPLRVRTFEAVATVGTGVYETFHGIATLMYRVLKERLESGDLEAAMNTTPAADAVVPAGTAPVAAETRGAPGANEFEFDSAIDSMLREVDGPGAARPAAPPRELVATGAPATAARPAAAAPVPAAQAPGQPAHQPPAGGRSMYGGAPPADAALPDYADTVSQTINSGSPALPPRGRESSAADDNLFEAVPDAPFDLHLGRLPALDEAAHASDHARSAGPAEFVTDPMRRATPPERSAPAPTPAAPAPVPLAPKPLAAAPAPVPMTVPVVLRRAQLESGTPVRIVLEVRVEEE